MVRHATLADDEMAMAWGSEAQLVKDAVQGNSNLLDAPNSYLLTLARRVHDVNEAIELARRATAKEIRDLPPPPTELVWFGYYWLAPTSAKASIAAQTSLAVNELVDVMKSYGMNNGTNVARAMVKERIPSSCLFGHGLARCLTRWTPADRKKLIQAAASGDRQTFENTALEVIDAIRSRSSKARS